MTKIERTKNTVTGAIWGCIERTASILLPFIVRTVLIKKLGSEYLGLSSLFSSILQVLNLTELGFGSAAVFAMYKPIAEDDYSTTGAILSYLNKIYKIIGFITICLGIVSAPFLKYLISGTVPTDVNIYILYFIYVFNTAISYLLFAHKRSLLTALQLNKITSKVGFFTNSFMRLLQIAVLLIMPNYYCYIILMPIFTIISNIVCSIVVDKNYKQWMCKGILDKSIEDDIKSRLFPLMSTKLAGVILNSADTLVISVYLGLTEVAIYNNYYYIMTSVSGFIITMYGAMQAGIGNALVTDSKEKIINDFNKFCFINNWIAVVCSTCLLCLYQPFMELWVGKDLMFSMGMVAMFCLYFFSVVALRIVVIYKDAAGIWREDMFRCYLSCAINLIINIVSVKYIGIYGVIGSSVLVSILIDPWIARTLFKVKFNLSPHNFYLNYILTLFICVLISTVSFIIVENFPNGWIGLVLKGIVCFFISNILLLMIYRKNATFNDVKNWVALKIKRRTLS